jgi:hypothetical protein
MDNSNKKHKASEPVIPKVEEPTVEYNVEEKIYANIEDHPLFAKVIEKSKKQHEQGLGFSHEEAMRRIKLKFPFLK